jgi:hypothetical protein
VKQYLDAGSIIIILITLLLFVMALFLKGLTQDLLLEAGIFLVSVKLIRMAYSIRMHNDGIMREIKEIKDAIKSG